MPWPAKIWHGSRRLISGLFLLFTGLSLYFALVHSNFLLAAETTTWLTVVMLAVLFALVALAICDNPLRRGIVRFWRANAWQGPLVVIALVLVWQITLILATHPVIGFDANMVHRALLHPQLAVTRGYFSQNANNLPLLLAQVALTALVGSKSWLALDWITLVLVDFAALCNLATVALVDRRRLKGAVLLQGIALLVFPSIIVPYTDTWVLPGVALSLLGFAGLFKEGLAWPLKSLFALLAGSGAAIAYLIKPSGMILVLGFGLVALLSGLTHFSWRRLLVGTWLTLLLIGSGAGLVVAGKQTQTGQSYIRINRALEIPAIHFVSIGMSGSRGEYSPTEALAMAKLPKRAAKVAYSKQMIKKHLVAKGWGYPAFLVRKQGYNTADGTFGWLGEGTFMYTGKPASDWRWFFQTLLYPTGANVACFRFVAQLVWVGLLVILVAAWRDRDPFTVGLRLSLIGTFVFLLIFEGGRSRYLIQALPLFWTLSALGWPSAKAALARLGRQTGLFQREVVADA